MAVDANFASLLQNLKLEDPWLPPKPWESIPSESGVSRSESNSASSFETLYHPSTIFEANLVRLALNALQGVHSSLDCIEKISAEFCSDPADRTSHRIPSMWHRSSSTSALGRILKSIGRSGFMVFLIRKFVDYFVCTNTNVAGQCRVNKEVGGKEVVSGSAKSQVHCGNEIGAEPPYSLVNQAFSVAVGKILEGYICALDTLYSSIELRRSSKNVDALSHVSVGVGCLTSVVHSGITLLEVYLHTKELRTRIDALGNICLLKNVGLAFSVSSLEDLTDKATMGFCNFPIAGNLLTYLYTQLRDADPVHRPLLKFLFLRSCEPYCGFIKSWIYQAKISDPYKEFLVEYVDDSPPYSCGKAGFLNDLPLASIKERVGVAIPCFLRDFCLPLIRAGQQLQVLILLLELCNSMISGNHTYEEILPCWSILSNDHLSYSTPLMFNKRDIEDMVLARNDMYRKMQDKAQHILTRLRTRYPKISCSALPYGKLPSPFNNCTEILHVPIPFASDERAVDGEDSEASSTTDEFSYAADPLEFSECSSLNSFDEKNDAEEPDDLHGSLIGLQTRFLSSSVLFTGFSVENLSQKQPETVKSHTFDCTSNKTFRPDNHLVNKLQELKLNHISVPLHPSTPTWSKMSDIQSEDYQYDMYWPLGGLSRNPFNVDTDFNFETPPHVTDSNLKVSNQSAEVLKGGSSYFGEMFPRNSALEQAAGKVQFENGNGAASNSFIFPSLESKCINTVLDINPMLTKNKWFHMMGMSGNRSFMDNNKYLSFFEFSSVEDPVKVNGERLLAGQNHEYQSENLSPYSVSAERGMVESEEEKHHDRGYIMADQEKLSDDCLPLESKENQQEEYPSADVSGGAKWENSLSYSGKGLIHGARGHKECLASTVEIPVDVIIDKCMLQEILLQYRYVSSLTIKLLEEGFDLQEHLLALRRYHFMELADWADLFIMSLWHHKWNVAEANQGIPVIQGFLNLAVQRSSCERDNYKDRLFVYTRGHGMMPISSSSIGIHSFDFIALGYKVDWPVNIVLTPGALRIYADIFSFLIQVKLAVFSLTDIWCFLKDFVHLISRIRGSGLHDQDMGYFNIIVKMRHQVNHFVSTLQQYVQSQLSQVSWCKFLHSLKHQVKDMLDLEVVHMTYLASSLNICFLSDETRPVASIIESILQCALDFRSCFIGNVRNVGLDQGDLAGLLAQINFTQVLAIKATFEKNLKDLYLCYLKSPKHGDFGLCRFWGYLNYNDYYSNIFGDGIIHFAP